MLHIRGTTGRQIVETDHLVTATQQALTEMGTEETGATIHENPLPGPPFRVDGGTVVLIVGNEITHYTNLPMRNQRG
jgi:hypothetical protein